MPLSSISDPGSYDIIFLPGGHGPMVDLAADEGLGQLLTQAYAAGGWVGWWVGGSRAMAVWRAWSCGGGDYGHVQGGQGGRAQSAGLAADTHTLHSRLGREAPGCRAGWCQPHGCFTICPNVVAHDSAAPVAPPAVQ